MVAIGLGHDPLDDVRDGEANASGDNPLKWPHYDPKKHGEDTGTGKSDAAPDQDSEPWSERRRKASMDVLRAAENNVHLGKLFSVDASPALENDSDKYWSEEKPQGGKRRFWTNKKKAGIVGTLLTGGGILAVFGLSTLAPLKITGIVSNLEGLFGAGGGFAQDRILQNMVNWYYTRDVLPGLQVGRCHSTISKNCVSLKAGDSLFDAWRKAMWQGHLESVLADKYGLEFGVKNGQYYMKTNVNGIEKTGKIPTQDFREMMNGKLNIFEEGAKIGMVGEKGTQAEMRAAINVALKDGTLADRVYFRLFLAPYLKDSKGIRYCMIACDAQDTFKDPIIKKKLAAKALFIQQIIEPASKEYGFALECVLAGGDLCDTKIQTADDLRGIDPSELSDYQKGLRSRLLTAADEGAVKLADVVELTSDISEKGFSNVIIEDVLKTLFPTVGGDIAKFGTKGLPVVGWVLLFAQIYVGAEKIGPILRIMGYAITAASAVQLYMMFRTVDSEMKAGHVDATELGSFYQALSTNFSGSSNDQVDATDTPLYGALFGGGTNRSTSNYRCNDGNPVPDGQLICPEEKLDKGNWFFEGVSKLANADPFLVIQANLLNRVNDFLGFLAGHGFDFYCNNIVNSPIPQYHDGPGTCPYAIKYAASLIAPISQGIINLLIPSPFTNDMSGGRTFDMMAAGADVSYNSSCRVNLGCARQSNQKIAEIRNQVLAEEKSSFEGQSVFARLFSTDSPYSLVSQLAIAMPASVPAAANDLATSISSPLSTLSSMFSTIFAGSHAFAAQQPIDDPFGVVQYGYSADQIPDDPQTYWNQHCQGDYRKAFFDGMPQDENTGEPLALTPEPCLLIETTIHASGTMFDGSLAPADRVNP